MKTFYQQIYSKLWSYLCKKDSLPISEQPTHFRTADHTYTLLPYLFELRSPLIKGELEVTDSLVLFLQHAQLLLAETNSIIVGTETERVPLSHHSLHSARVILQSLDLCGRSKRLCHHDLLTICSNTINCRKHMARTGKLFYHGNIPPVLKQNGTGSSNYKLLRAKQGQLIT